MYISFPSFLSILTFLRNGPTQSAKPLPFSVAKFTHQAIPIDEPAAVVEKRQLELGWRPTTTSASVNPVPEILTFFTPSPFADLVPITKQSQVETSYVPQLTLCGPPPLTLVSGKLTLQETTTQPPYRNLSSLSLPRNESCYTVYSSTATTICATVLIGIATRVTISQV